MNINSDNYFELFSLKESFQPNLDQLNQSYKKLQGQYHPDKVVNESDQVRLQALQTTSIINQAFETLSSPLKRSAYLLSLHGVDPEANVQSDFGEAFLFKQMDDRDKLEEIAKNENMDLLEKLKKEIESETHDFFIDFEKCYNLKNYDSAKPIYSKLQFLTKLLSEIDSVEEKILDY